MAGFIYLNFKKKKKKSNYYYDEIKNNLTEIIEHSNILV